MARNQRGLSWHGEEVLLSGSLGASEGAAARGGADGSVRRGRSWGDAAWSVRGCYGAREPRSRPA